MTHRPDYDDPAYGEWADRQQDYADERARRRFGVCLCPDMIGMPGRCPGVDSCPLQEHDERIQWERGATRGEAARQATAQGNPAVPAGSLQDHEEEAEE